MNFADGQRRTCRLQIFSLPSANETFAIGKCLAGRRQISYRINGKLLVCHRQIFSLPPANFLFAIQPQICGCVLAACRAAASSSTGEEGGGRGGKNTVQRIIKKNESPHPQADKKQAVRANTETPRRDPQRKSAACSTQNQNRTDSKENNPMCKPQRQSSNAGREGGDWGGRETTPLKQRVLSLPGKTQHREQQRKTKALTRRLTKNRPCVPTQKLPAETRKENQPRAAHRTKTALTPKKTIPCANRSGNHPMLEEREGTGEGEKQRL